MYYYGFILYFYFLKIFIIDRVGFNGIYIKSEKSSKLLLKVYFDVFFKL